MTHWNLEYQRHIPFSQHFEVAVKMEFLLKEKLEQEVQKLAM